MTDQHESAVTLACVRFVESARELGSSLASVWEIVSRAEIRKLLEPHVGELGVPDDVADWFGFWWNGSPEVDLIPMLHHACIFYRPLEPGSLDYSILQGAKRDSLMNYQSGEVLSERWEPEAALPVCGPFDPMIIVAPTSDPDDWRLYSYNLRSAGPVVVYNERFGSEPWRLIDFIETAQLYLDQGIMGFDEEYGERANGPNVDTGVVYPNRAPWLKRRGYEQMRSI